MFNYNFSPDNIGSFQEFSSKFTKLSEQVVNNLYGSALSKLREYMAGQIGITTAELHQFNPSNDLSEGVNT
ncbi:MAG: hypothetical protein AAB459_00075 [Patescibacteria group bacterium]